jgi:hypothetical protein
VLRVLAQNVKKKNEQVAWYGSLMEEDGWEEETTIGADWEPPSCRHFDNSYTHPIEIGTTWNHVGGKGFRQVPRVAK